MPESMDLHLHTRASDGQWTPAGLIARARAIGVGTIAVTDHDVTDAVHPARSLGASAAITVIPGVEVTVHWRKVPLHLLVYGEPVLGATVSALLARARESVDQWVRFRANALPDGLVRSRLLSRNDTLSVAALVRAARGCGVAISHGMPDEKVNQLHPAAIPGLDLTEVADIAHSVGAVPILAHPMRVGTLTRALDIHTLEALLDEVPAILGVEVMHPRHGQPQREALAELASRRAILVTAGSDSHGPARARPPIGWPEELSRDFLERVRP